MEKKYRRSNNNPLYPITYKGEDMYEEDCDQIFVTFYNSIESLGWDKSVYVNKDVGRILPDGEWSKEL